LRDDSSSAMVLGRSARRKRVRSIGTLAPPVKIIGADFSKLEIAQTDVGVLAGRRGSASPARRPDAAPGRRRRDAVLVDAE